MSDISNYYNSASLTHQIQNNKGLLKDLDEKVLFFKDDISTKFALLQISNYPYWHPDVPADIRESEIWKDMVKYNKTINVINKIQNGNQSELSAMSGLQGDGLEATGLEKYENEIIQPGKIIYMFAEMDKGKTFFASLGLNLFWNKIKHRSSDAKKENIIGSNLKTVGGSYCNNIPKLVDWLKNTDKDKLFLFDEASLHANSFNGGHNTYSGLLPLIILIRRYSGRIIFIGHSGNDLGRQIRKMATVVSKDSRKKATFYKGIDDQGEPYGKKFSLYSIPEMIDGAEKEGFLPNTHDKGSWEWTDRDDDIIRKELNGENIDNIQGYDGSCKKDGCNAKITNKNGYCPSHSN